MGIAIAYAGVVGEARSDEAPPARTLSKNRVDRRVFPTEPIFLVDPENLFLGLVAGFEAEPEGVRVLLETNRASMVMTADGKYYFSSKQKGSFRMTTNREVWISAPHCALKLKPMPTPFSSNGFFVFRCEQKHENPGFETNVAAVVLVPSEEPVVAVVEPNMEAVRCVLQGKTKARPTWKHLQAESCSDRDTVEQGGAAPKTAKPGTPNRPAPTQWPWLAGVTVLLLVAGGILFKVLRR
ncbi:MAG: hypothetical protein IT577_19025 [Verrucomicrobiae bacterium]|nr:hypothetical protein [Verrucomicrobiae bacterium]